MATPASDYVALSGTVIIPAGAVSAPVVITPIDDTLMEGNERVAYTLGTATTATVTIISDEHLSIAATDPIATEAGRTTATLRAAQAVRPRR